MSATVQAPARKLPRLNALGSVAALLVAACLLLAVFGPALAPYQPGQIVRRRARRP